MYDKMGFEKQRGFSLMEILIVISIITFIFIISSDFIVKGLVSTTFNREQESAVSAARRASAIMVTEIRSATNSASNTPAISKAMPQEIIFYSDITGDSLPDQIRYYVVGTKLKRGLIESASTSPYYTGMESVTDIVGYMNNQSEAIFTYHSTSTSPLADPENNLSLIKRVNLNLKINVTPHRAPADVYVTSVAQIRNLKDY